MIINKDDLKRYLEIERKLFLSRNYGKTAVHRKHPRWFGEYEWKYVISLRNIEYYGNTKKSRGMGSLPQYLFHKIRYSLLSNIFCVHIPPNVFGEGLFIQHLHGIFISAKVKAGDYCGLFHNTTIGISVGHGHGECPTIGDGVTICTGAVIVGDIYIADDITIAANAVVTKNFEKSRCVVGGVPAKMIKEQAEFSMRVYSDSIL